MPKSLVELPKLLLSQIDTKHQSSPAVRASAENELLSEAVVSENNEAIAIYQQILKVNPNSAKAHFLLGKLQLFTPGSPIF